MNEPTITSAEQYDAALARIIALAEFDPMPDTPEGVELDALARAVERYERIHFPLGLPLP